MMKNKLRNYVFKERKKKLRLSSMTSSKTTVHRAFKKDDQVSLSMTLITLH